MITTRPRIPMPLMLLLELDEGVLSRRRPLSLRPAPFSLRSLSLDVMMAVGSWKRVTRGSWEVVSPEMIISSPHVLRTFGWVMRADGCRRVGGGGLTVDVRTVGGGLATSPKPAATTTVTGTGRLSFASLIQPPPSPCPSLYAVPIAVHPPHRSLRGSLLQQQRHCSSPTNTTCVCPGEPHHHRDASPSRLPSFPSPPAA